MQDGKRPTSPAGARPAASPTPPTSINRAMHDRCSGYDEGMFSTNCGYYYENQSLHEEKAKTYIHRSRP